MGSNNEKINDVDHFGSEDGNDDGFWQTIGGCGSEAVNTMEERVQDRKRYEFKSRSNVEIFYTGTSSPITPRGLDHCITAPISANGRLLIEPNEITYFRSLTDKRDTPRHDMRLDRLSERERKQLIADLVKIQSDGTVEVDIANSSPVTSELLELHQVEGTSFHFDDTVIASNKSIPRLKIAMLVVGTRGDVQPFLAIAKRLQEFGHHVIF